MQSARGPKGKRGRCRRTDMDLIFTCPVCQGPLTRETGRCVCPQGHRFDLSARGYVNLLPPSHRGDHGDNRQMIAARRAFLDGGWYQPLLDGAVEICRTLPDVKTLLDTGCGEGYYTDGILSALPGVRGFGIDISKDALRFAGVRKSVTEGRLALAAASVYRMPVASGTVDLVLDFFSPLATEEFIRVLKAGGYFLYAIPGPRHLFGLKEVLYDTPYENRLSDTALPGFRLVCEREVEGTLRLTEASQIRSLFMMTPYAYRTGARGRERLEQLSELVTPISFRLLLYRREG